MSHFLKEIFEILFEIIEFSEPYLLVTTIFFIPFTITVTSLPKRFFQYEFTQHLLPSLFAKYESRKAQLERINAMTQNAMIVILMIDLFGLGHFFFGSHGGHEGGSHHEAGAHGGENEHPSQHGAEAVGEHAPPVEH
jgi:hypothetical protein